MLFMMSLNTTLSVGYIAWHGRYSAYDYGSFAAFMRHTFSEVSAVPCPVFKCDNCKNDTSIDEEAIGKFNFYNCVVVSCLRLHTHDKCQPIFFVTVWLVIIF